MRLARARPRGAVLARSRVALCGVGTLARMATFDARKALERDAVVLGDAEASARDRSRAGRVDARCEAIVREVFASDDFFTTSSCSGRVSVFAERGRGKREGKGEGGTWAYVSHEPALGEAVAAAVRAHAGEGEEGDGEAAKATAGRNRR